MSPVTYTKDHERVGWIVFDDPAGRANIFNAATRAAFDAALTAAETDAPRALVIASGKERIFVAGADLHELAGLPYEATAFEFARTGQQLFERIANFPAAVVCAIHGACAGGGFELALACHWRIASDAPVTRIGLPETGLGMIPGWGGTVRLPRLVGAKPALDHILKGQLLGAADALAARLVDAVVPATELRARAKAEALRLAAGGVPARATPCPTGADEISRLRESVWMKTRGHHPAPLAAIDVVERTASLTVAAALPAEARTFATLAAGEVAKNLLHVSAVNEAARKRTLTGWFSSATATPPAITRVGVVGAGVMGSGIAQWCAARGFNVVLRDVQPAFVERGLTTIRNLCDEAVKRGGMTAADAVAARGRIATTTGWEGFDRCDLVIEAIVEDVAAKKKLFNELAAVARADALLASNTSALPIEEIAGHVPNPARTFGLHFFNPVGRMSLVELVLARETSAPAAERALAFVKSLGKTPVICRSSPGFLVTRVLFFYLNEAVELWEAGVATETLDAAMREFGWPMGPMRLIDEVGVDVTDFIFGELAHYFPERFVRSTACARLLERGLTGRKGGTGAGFFRYDTRPESLNDHATRAAFAAGGERRLSAEEISERLMDVMINEARRCLDEGVVKSADDVDFALLSGAGFPAFRGGLMRYAQGTPQPAPAAMD